MEEIFLTKEYKRSRKAYMFQSTFEYFISILVADVYLATLLSYMGISDALIGIISSLISFAFLFQLLALILVKKITNTKKTVIIFSSLAQLLFLSIYLLPFTTFSKELKSILVIVFILTAHASNRMVSGLLFKWANSFVVPEKRASYSAKKEVISLVTGIVFTYAVGQTMDYYMELNDITGGFLFIAITMLILNVCNFISLMMINKESVAMFRESKKKSDTRFRAVFNNVMRNKNFVSVIIMTALWYTGRYMTIGFLGSFKTKDLLIGVGLAQIMNIIGNIMRAVLSKPFGQLSDRRGYAVGMKCGLLLELLSYVVIIFTTQRTWWLMFLYALFHSIGMAGTNQNSFNITYSYVDSRYLVQAMAIKNSIGGLCGFIATLFAGWILEFIQKSGNQMFGIPMYGQQLLACISVIIMAFVILYIKNVIEKQEVTIQ